MCVYFMFAGRGKNEAWKITYGKSWSNCKAMLKNSPFSSWSEKEPTRGFFKHGEVMNRLQCLWGPKLQAWILAVGFWVTLAWSTGKENEGKRTWAHLRDTGSKPDWIWCFSGHLITARDSKSYAEYWRNRKGKKVPVNGHVK